MQSHHRDKLRSNLNALCAAMSSVDQLIPYALKEKLYSERMVDEFMDASLSPTRCKINFILGLEKRGSQAFDKFIQCLVQSGNYNAARILVPNINLPPNDAINTRRITETTLTEPIGEIVVKPALQYNNGKLEKDVYKMRSKPRGLALIFANTNFLDTRYSKRNGCQQDLRMLRELFNGLGYQVIEHENKTTADVERILDDFVVKPELARVHSCIVAVSSHGELEGFVCTDGYPYSVENLVKKFNNQNCPSLKHKPKVFFVQACRGSYVDGGEPTAGPEPTTSLQRDGLIPISLLSTPTESACRDQPRVCTNSDMLIVYSTQPGLVSFRDERNGSWLYQVLTKVFMEDAWKDHVQDLLKTVMRGVSRLKAEGIGPDGAKQPMEMVDKVFAYDMYFNPGLL